MTDEQLRKLRERLRKPTDEQFDAAWDAMVRDGIIDADGNVLKRIPEPPDWLTGRNGQAKPEAPARKAKKPRKRS